MFHSQFARLMITLGQFLLWLLTHIVPFALSCMAILTEMCSTSAEPGCYLATELTLILNEIFSVNLIVCCTSNTFTSYHVYHRRSPLDRSSYLGCHCSHLGHLRILVDLRSMVAYRHSTCHMIDVLMRTPNSFRTIDYEGRLVLGPYQGPRI